MQRILTQLISGDVEVWTLMISCLTLLMSVAAGVVCYFRVKPSDEKMAKVSAALELQNARINGLQSAIIDSRIRTEELRYQKRLDAYLMLLKAMRHLRKVNGLLTACRVLRDLTEIKETLRETAEADRFRQWLLDQIPPDAISAPVLTDVEDVQIFVSDRAWRLYNLMHSVGSIAIAKVHLIGLKEIKGVIKESCFLENVRAVYPDEVEYVKKFGTTWYSHLFQKAENEIVVLAKKFFEGATVDIDELVSESQLDRKVEIDEMTVPKEYGWAKTSK